MAKEGIRIRFTLESKKYESKSKLVSFLSVNNTMGTEMGIIL